MVKITDVLGAMVEAQMKAQAWEAEFQAAFFGPLRLAEQVQQFLAAVPEQRAAMMAQAPDAHAAMRAHARRMQQSAGRMSADMRPPDGSPEPAIRGMRPPTEGG